MARIQRFLLLSVSLLILSCVDPESPGDSEVAGAPNLAAGPTLKLTGSGHHTRTVGAKTLMTIFTFNATQKGDALAKGRYHYAFRAAGFTVDGPVTCLSVAGNQMWVGGVVEKITSDDPTDQDLVGLDMWWRSIDGGEAGVTDSTTGLGFAFAGSVITKESWCRDQPVALIMRAVERGGLRVYR